MTKEEAVKKALAYVQATALDLGPLVEARYVSLRHLDELAKNCPSNLLATYNSIRKNFRNQWVVSFKRNEERGQVTNPETHLVCVYDSGEVVIA